MAQADPAKLYMIERVTVRKFDKTLEDNPEEPYEVIERETKTEITVADALAMGWTPKDST